MESKEQASVGLKEVFANMTTSIKKEPVLILRIDGEDLKEFVDSSQFEPEVISIYSKMKLVSTLHESMTMALEELTIEHGMPPSSDSWVSTNIIQPALKSIQEDKLEMHTSQETFLQEFKKLMYIIVLHLQEHPVIVAHTENTFDGSNIKRLLSDKFELHKMLNALWNNLSKDDNQREPRELLQSALDGISSLIALPPYGTINQLVDVTVNDVLDMVNIGNKKITHEEEFKNIMIEILERLMLQLEANPFTSSSNSVVHEPMVSSSNISDMSSPSSMSSQEEAMDHSSGN